MVEPRRRKPDHDDDDEKRRSRDARQIVEAINCMELTMAGVLHEISELLRYPPHGGTLRVALTLAQSGGSPVPSPPEVLPPQTAFADHKQPVNTIPTKADGTPDTEVVVSCVSSDPASVGTEPNPAGGFFITTPMESGTATITLSAPGYQSAQFDFSYGPPVEGKLNVFFGEDVPE